MKDWEADGWIGFGIICIIATAIGFGFVAAVMSAKADGRADFCYTEQPTHEHGEYTVKQHVPWREDRTIGVFLSPVEAAEFQEGVCGRE